tara:strand:+ start:3195 stop:3437 length:243 start_codon:yes stop_codon:yes gene_type:complete
MKNLIDLVLIIITAFLLVFVVSAIIFTVIIPLNNPFTFEFGEILIVIIKLITSFILFLIWILIIQKIIMRYLEKRLKETN